MSKQKTNKRSTREGAGASTDKQLRELDAELSRRLDATLGAHAKFELEAMRALARLAPLEEESSSSREEAARPRRAARFRPGSRGRRQGGPSDDRGRWPEC